MRRCLPPAPRLKPSIRGSAVVVAAVLGLVLAGCQVPFPSPQRGRIPSPFPGIPGGGATIPSPLPSPSSSPIPSLPSPSLPSPSSPSLPSPSLPSPSLPSPSSPPTGNPSPFPLPGSQSSGSGDGGSPSAWPPSGGGPQQGGGEGGLEPPAGGEDSGEAGSPDTGWEVSNEAGEIPGPDARSGQGAGTETNGQEDGDGQIDALERALGELDGEILDERVVTTAGSQRQPSRGGGDTPGNVVPAPPNAEPSVSRPPIPLAPDQPDARDDDVVARQIREAAMAETDPELREQLWEEYRRYKSGL